MTRIKIHKRKKHSSRRCKRHRYGIAYNGAGAKLECKDCGRFLGYIKNEKELSHYKHELAASGFITWRE